LSSSKTHVEQYDRSIGIFVILLVTLYLGILVAAIVLARRNLKNGRGDRRGAFRLAFVTVFLLVMTWLIEGNHTLTATELRYAVEAIARSLFVGMAIYVLYIALEPEVRRRWPGRIVSWARLLDGRFTDPLVARDILVGTLLGLASQVIRNLVPMMG